MLRDSPICRWRIEPAQESVLSVYGWNSNVRAAYLPRMRLCGIDFDVGEQDPECC